MAEDTDQGEKTEDPSAHRIEEFRKRGEVASSKELTSVLVLSASFLTLGLTMVFIYEVMTQYIEWLYSLELSKAYSEKMLKMIASKTVMTALKCTGPLFLVVVCIGVISTVAQIGFLFSPEVLSFKPDRINPINGAKRLFSMRSIVEAAKGFFKFLFILSIVYLFMKDEIRSFGGFLHLDFSQSFLFGKTFLLKLAFSIIAGLVVIALGDFAYQKYSYWQKLKMTKEEAKREHKEQEGSPEVKQRIKAIQREMAQKRMIAEIPNADVIVTNPTHISIAIKYDPENMISPEVVAKGADHMAMKIREIAKKHDIPLVENVPLARTLYKTVGLGSAVPRSLYKAVAEVLAFVYKLKKKKQALDSSPRV
ncbi:MAG: flagellar biosynthesis protein FlhB [Deltaproteobacteria bacterium]|nr:MAG: flagellar biosynthesis protein FlhB [Deltaproteobacteria bacterium]TNF28399.1 MAG: flagellar biosynthesis protein FlhB [Deltaproteobacteria bacterium]